MIFFMFGGESKRYNLRWVSMKKLSFISIERLLEMKANNQKFTLVDVLPEESYEEGHISGAINIPLGNLEPLGRQGRKATVATCGP